MEENRESIEILPNELILIIASFLNDYDLYQLMKTSPRFYKVLCGEFEKTHTFGKFLHDFFLGFYLTKRENSVALYDSDYGKRFGFKIEKYCNFANLKDSIFVISRIGNIWSWKNASLGSIGKYKQITCQCESEYCPKDDFIVDINMRTNILSIAIKLDMWPNFLKEKPGFKKAFEIIKKDLIESDDQELMNQLLPKEL